MSSPTPAGTADAPSRETTLFGSRVRYWMYGPADGRTILAVHGFRGNHGGLARIIAGLGEYRVIVPDLPGYGLSTPMTELAHDVAGYTRFVEAFIGELELDRPVLLGHSYGSIVAAALAAEHPELVSELVLVNPIACLPSAGWNLPVSRFVEAYYGLGAALPGRWGDRVIASRTFNRLMSLSLTKTRDREKRRAIRMHHLSDLEYPQHRHVITESYRDSLVRTAADAAERIPHRTLMVAGDRDAIAPARYQRRMHAALADGTLVLIPGVGHLVHLETPAQAAAAIGDFLG